MNWHEGETIYDRLDEIERRRQAPPSPPQPTRPVLITEDGEFARIAEEFTVYLSKTDPNAVRGMGQWITFRKVWER